MENNNVNHVIQKYFNENWIKKHNINPYINLCYLIMRIFQWQ